jgi:hypothetical protein
MDPSWTAASFLAAACGVLGVDRQHLASRCRDRETARLRELLATLGVERYGLRAKDLALQLNKHPDWVSHWVGQGARRRVADPAYRERLDSLDAQLRTAPRGEERETAPVEAPELTPDWAAWL